jgi:hypothetical protein
MEEPGSARPLPALEQLEATPAILNLLAGGLTEDEAAWKPALERFSIAETVAHLAHAERHCYGTRWGQWASEEEPKFDSYDTDAFVAAGAYSGRPLREALAAFDHERSQNLVLLRSLPEGAADRTAIHALYGRITMSYLLYECATHDLGHIRQIAELLRAVRYFPRLGPFQPNYKLNP